MIAQSAQRRRGVAPTRFLSGLATWRSLREQNLTLFSE
jgi:hypothetical protein